MLCTSVGDAQIAPTYKTNIDITRQCTYLHVTHIAYIPCTYLQEDYDSGVKACPLSSRKLLKLWYPGLLPRAKTSNHPETALLLCQPQGFLWHGIFRASNVHGGNADCYGDTVLFDRYGG
jgi:hypothetical protein